MQLQWEVSAALIRVPSVDGAGIRVTVSDRIVTLTGSVDSYLDKWTAAHAAGRVAGVRALVVELHVNLPGVGPRSDADIARAVVHALDWSACLPDNWVRAMVDNGHVTLSGEVEWDYQREDAAAVVRWLAGVTGVSNNTTLRPRVSPAGAGSRGSAAPPRRFDIGTAQQATPRQQAEVSTRS